jgi:hypothetical protein
VSDFKRVADIASKLPGAEQAMSWGTPSFKAGGKMFLRQHEDPDLIVLKVTPEERTALTQTRPDTFIVTPHYENYPYMLVRTADLDKKELRELITEAWRMCAPKRVVKSFDAGD